MKNLKLHFRKFLRTIFGCLSFTAVAFVFQACYGTGPDPYYDIRLTGTVKSKTTQMPIKGVKVLLKIDVYGEKLYNFGITDNRGYFDFYASVPEWDYMIDGVHYPADSVKVNFMDIDSIENGYFEDKTIVIDPAHKDEVKIYAELEPKQ